MSAVDFFNSCIDLFVSALSAIIDHPVLALFASLPCLLAAVALLGYAVRSTRRL